MGSIRQEKMASMLKRELALIFQRESRNLFGGMFITVTQVRMVPDMGLAKVYLSFMAVEDKEAALQKVIDQKWHVKKGLTDTVGKNLRKTPDVNFYLDDSLDYYENIDNLLKS